MKIAKSRAMIVTGPDVPQGYGFIHWIAWNMELVRMIPEKSQNADRYFSNQSRARIKQFRKADTTARVLHVDRHTIFSLTYMHRTLILHWPQVLQRNSSKKRWKDMSSTMAKRM